MTNIRIRPRPDWQLEDALGGRRRLARILPALAIAAALTLPAINTDTALACTKARIGGVTKCLQRGQFCSAAYKSQYPKYGLRCVNGRLR